MKTTTKTTDLESLVREHCAEDEMRMQMAAPVLIGDYLYATDGNTMIKVPVSKINFEHNNAFPFPEAATVWDKFQANTSLFIPLVDFTEQLSRIELINEVIFKDCEECEGGGSIEETCPCCEHTNYTSCLNCAGDGEIEATGKKMVPNWAAYLIEIKGVRFYPAFVARMIKACSIEKTDTVELTRTADREANKFKIGELEFLIMPNMGEEPTILKVV